MGEWENGRKGEWNNACLPKLRFIEMKAGNNGILEDWRIGITGFRCI